MLRRHQPAAPDRCAEEQREGHLPTEHVMDFSGLIDDLVHRDKTKRYLAPVDDRAETAPGRSDADAGKGGFRDRRRLDPLRPEFVKQRWQRVGRHVKDLGVAPHLLGDGFERGLVICQLSHRRLLASGLKHIVGRLLGQRERAGLGEGDSGFEHAHNVAFHAPQPRIVQLALVAQLPFESRDRITPLPGFNFGWVARIGLPAALGMGPPAVGLALDQRRTLPRSSPPHRAVRGLVDGKDVVAVDHDTGNTVTGSPCRDIAQRMRHGSRGLRLVHIVLADIDHRQIPGRRDVEALVERPGIRSAVAEKRYRDAALSLHLRRKSGAGDNRYSARDNAVGAEHADVEIGDMHRATLAFAVAGLPAVQLRHHAVEIGTLGDAMAMASMRRDDPVVALKGAANADRDRLLADIAMHDAVDLPGEVVRRGALLKAPDHQHLAQHLALLVRWQIGREAHHGCPSLSEARAAELLEKVGPSARPSVPRVGSVFSRTCLIQCSLLPCCSYGRWRKRCGSRSMYLKSEVVGMAALSIYPRPQYSR